MAQVTKTRGKVVDGAPDPGNNDIFTVGPKAVPKKQEAPAYRIYKDSKVAVSKAVGKMWKSKYDAAMAAYELIYQAWEMNFQYYNNNQTKSMITPAGYFGRGDATENIIYSNINTMLPAVYTKNPDFTCSTTDKGDDDFCTALEALLNVLFKSRQHMNAKPKIKRSTGMALLTNLGAFKIDFVRRDDSREIAQAALEDITAKLEKVKTQKEAAELYGQLQALEAQMELSLPKGHSMAGVMPQDLLVDPAAEISDGTDAEWMIERCWLPTEYLKARFTQPMDEGDGTALVYQPTHQVTFNEGGKGSELGAIVKKIESQNTTRPVSYTDEQRLAYLHTYMTECYWVWDKVTRRVFLFHRDDWTWPLWVWDDPLKLSRFFPYFILAFSFSTGSTVSVGEVSYYLDQQDEVNTINKEVTRIRNIVFNFFLYNSNKLSPEDAETLSKMLRGEPQNGKNFLGIKADENLKLKDLVEIISPPAMDYQALFNKQPAMSAINRISGTNDALRGTEFKTNTNKAAVQSYHDALELQVGAKVDVLEDTLADCGHAAAELAIQYMTQEEVAGLIGPALAKGWRTMDVAEFNATYSLEIVAGSTDKPTSAFKKKEALNVAQALGQFGQAAPGATMTIMLNMLQKAFTDLNVRPEDWDMLKQEIAANLSKGVSQAQPNGGAAPQEGAPQGGGAPQGNGQADPYQNVPPEVKQRVLAMKAKGATPQQILAFINQNVKQPAAPTQ